MGDRHMGGSFALCFVSLGETVVRVLQLLSPRCVFRDLPDYFGPLHSD